MFKKSLIVVLLSCVSTFLFAQNGNWKVVKYKVNFTIKNTGIKVEGSFVGLEAMLNFDEHNNSNSFKASVNTNTINTGINARDNHLKKEDYFNVNKFPIITIESTKITTIGGGKYLADCIVKMKGVTKHISMPFTYSYVNNLGLFKGTLVLNRLDFNVGESSFVLADDVLINLIIEATKN